MNCCPYSTIRQYVIRFQNISICNRFVNSREEFWWVNRFVQPFYAGFSKFSADILLWSDFTLHFATCLSCLLTDLIWFTLNYIYHPDWWHIDYLTASTLIVGLMVKFYENLFLVMEDIFWVCDGCRKSYFPRKSFIHLLQEGTMEKFFWRRMILLKK